MNLEIISEQFPNKFPSCKSAFKATKHKALEICIKFIFAHISEHISEQNLTLKTLDIGWFKSNRQSRQTNY
jgi:hypothetical protein